MTVVPSSSTATLPTLQRFVDPSKRFSMIGRVPTASRVFTRSRISTVLRRVAVGVVRAGAPRNPLGQPFELLGAHVREHLVVDPGDERPRARELPRPLQPALGETTVQLDRSTAEITHPQRDGDRV